MIIINDDPNDGSWDALTSQCGLSNIYALQAWGDYKTRIGWTVKRLILRDQDGRPLAFVQCQQRKKGPMRFILAQGCPLLTDRGTFQAKEILSAFINHLKLGRFDLLGIKYHQFQSHEATLALLAQGFKPVISAKDHTLEVDLTQTLDTIRASLDARWRNALIKAERNVDLTITFLTNPADRLQAFDEFEHLYAALQMRKGFANSLNTKAYRDLAAHDACLEFQEVREKGKPILIRMTHKARHRWTDFFVASNERARATEAPRLALWRTLEKAQRDGASTFDLGGIDPLNNRGVFVFKAGVTRHVVQATPLWLHGRTPIIRDVAAALLSRR